MPMHPTDNLNAILGEPLHWQGAMPPQQVPLEGRYVRLEPLDPTRHASSLYLASQGENANPHLWDYMPYSPFPTLGAYTEWLKANVSARDTVFFALVPLSGPGSETAQGQTALMRIMPEHGTVEIGHVWYGAGLQKTRAATEAIYLMLRSAFDLGFRRVEWKCHNSNQPSRRAALRYGFTFEGIFRAHMVVKGRNRDTAWFSMLDTEWPRHRIAFEAWLDESNFDSKGQQRQTLAELRPQT